MEDVDALLSRLENQLEAPATTAVPVAQTCRSRRPRIVRGGGVCRTRQVAQEVAQPPLGPGPNRARTRTREASRTRRRHRSAARGGLPGLHGLARSGRLDARDRSGTGVRRQAGRGRPTRGVVGAGPVGFLDTMVVTEWVDSRRVVVEHTGRVVRGSRNDGGARTSRRSQPVHLVRGPAASLGALGAVGWRLFNRCSRSPFVALDSWRLVEQLGRRQRGGD